MMQVPDYYRVVKKPIDLRTIEDKCISDVYLKPQQFIDDFSIMMKNAEQYNEVMLNLFLRKYVNHKSVFIILIQCILAEGSA